MKEFVILPFNLYQKAANSEMYRIKCPVKYNLFMDFVNTQT